MSDGDSDQKSGSANIDSGSDLISEPTSESGTDFAEYEQIQEQKLKPGRSFQKKKESDPYALGILSYASSQVNNDFIPSFGQITPVDIKHPSSRDSLLKQYHEVINDYIKTVDTSDLTSLRAEVIEKLRQRSHYQMSSYGESDIFYDGLPSNLYNSFVVSLYLQVSNETIAFKSNPPGFDFSCDLNQSSLIFQYLAIGFIPPSFFQDLVHLQLVWYDGSIICEIFDTRHHIDHSIRIALRPLPEEIANTNYEVERPFLLAQSPLLCLDTSPQVANIARLAANDRNRWMFLPPKFETKKQQIAIKKPELFLVSIHHDKHVTPEQQKQFKQRMIERLKNANFD